MGSGFVGKGFMVNKFWILALPLLFFTACERTKSSVSAAPAPTAETGAVETFPDRPDLATRMGEAEVAETDMDADMDAGMGVDMGADIGEMEQAYLDADVGSKAYFDFNRYNIRRDAAAVLRKQAEWLMSNPPVKVMVAGHCDARGSREYNLALGERRANAVKDFLVSQGVASSRVSTVSYGKERPAVIGDTEAAYALNRRAVTSVLR